MGNTLKSMGNSEDFPECEVAPSFDPLIGFPKGRKERVSKATEQEMIAAKIPPMFRDYCAHKYLDMKACERLHFPIYQKCKHVHHEYVQCVGEDYVLRMKEYERERRLRRRQKRKEEAMKAASA